MKSYLGQARWRFGLATLTLCMILCAGCVPPNNPPVISGLEAEKVRVVSLTSCEFRCTASDADGDDLTYTWSADGGTFSGTGSVNTWMAPDKSGTCNIKVTVADGRGGEDAIQLTVEVLGNHPPVIENLTAEPLVVLQNETTTITCGASDPDGDELSYQWTVDEGTITGQGSTVDWTAPSACTTYFIVVTVTDGRGGEVSEELEIRVKKPG